MCYSSKSVVNCQLRADCAVCHSCKCSTCRIFLICCQCERKVFGCRSVYTVIAEGLLHLWSVIRWSDGVGVGEGRWRRIFGSSCPFTLSCITRVLSFIYYFFISNRIDFKSCSFFPIYIDGRLVDGRVVGDTTNCVLILFRSSLRKCLGDIVGILTFAVIGYRIKSYLTICVILLCLQRIANINSIFAPQTESIIVCFQILSGQGLGCFQTCLYRHFLISDGDGIFRRINICSCVFIRCRYAENPCRHCFILSIYFDCDTR